MKIQGFIFNWKGHEANAAALEASMARSIPVTVINSEERLSRPRPGWVQLDDTAYFSAQWNQAVARFDADIFFHMQADAEFDQFEALFARVQSLWEKHRLGVYEPRVDFTGIQYARRLLPELEPGLLEVPLTDCTCWFIEGTVLRKLPPVDVSVNRYGWNICTAVAALARLDGRRCVRDLHFRVRHPRSRGYSTEDARQEGGAYKQTLSAEVREEMSRVAALYRERQARPPRRLPADLPPAAATDAPRRRWWAPWRTGE